MRDEDIHQGLVAVPPSRRAVMMAGAMVAGLGSVALTDSVVEKDVTVPTPNGSADAALFHPAGKGPWPAVLLWTDILGLRPVFRDIARRLSAEGYVVLVPNPFYRARHAPVVDDAFDLDKPQDRAKVVALRQAITDADIDRDSTAYLQFLDLQPVVDRRKKAGVHGYCMGGPFAFHTAAAASGRIGAVASFHGGFLVTTEPSSPHLLVSRTHAAYLVCIAQDDDAKQPEAKTTLRAAFAAARCPATVEVYPANHGWCVPGRQTYNAAAAERAWGELSRFYKATLV